MTFAVLADRRFVAAAGVLFAIYLATLAVTPKRVFWTPDEGAKWLEMHSVRIESDLRYFIAFPAQRVDPEFHYLPYRAIFPRPSIGADNNLYLAFETPVVFPLLSSVGLSLFGIVGIYLLPLLSGWLTAVLAGAVAAMVRPAAGPPTLLLVGLATPIWFYSVLFWEHTVATALALIAVTFVAAAPPLSLTALLAALLALLAAVTLRLELMAFAVALVVAWGIAGLSSRASDAGRTAAQLLRRPSLTKVLVYLALAIAAAAALVFLRMSLTVRHSTMMSLLPQRLQTGAETLWQSPWSVLDVFVHSSISEALPASDAWVLAGAGGIVLCLAAAAMRRVRWESALLIPGFILVSAFSLSLLCVGETYRALHGFVPIAPFMVVASYAWSGSRQARQNYVLVLLSILAVVHCFASMLAISTIYLEFGRLARDVGIEWGQRYMLSLYAIFAILAVVAVQQYWLSPRPLWLRRFFVGAVALLVLMGVAFEIRGNAMLYLTRVRLTVWEDAMRQEGPIVTDVWWLPASFAIFYTEHEMYYVDRRGDVAGWVDQATAHGVKGFTFASLAPVDAMELGSERIRLASTQQKNIDELFLTRFVLTSPEGSPIQPAD